MISDLRIGLGFTRSRKRNAKTLRLGWLSQIYVDKDSGRLAGLRVSFQNDRNTIRATFRYHIFLEWQVDWELATHE